MMWGARQLRQIAVVNGIHVLSDKPGGITIISGRLMFADGSTYDGTTGMVVNAGAGRIELRSDSGSVLSSSGSGTPNDPPQTIEYGAVTSVQISGVAGHLEVIPHPAAVCSVTAAATTRAVMSGSDLIVSGGANVVVRVPVGTAVVLAAEGDTRIGDIGGPLTVSAAGCNDVDAGAVSALHATVTGSSDIRVARVDGDCTIDVSGASDVSVRAGRIRHLTARVTGSGDVAVHADVQTATLTVTGSGSITAHRVAGHSHEHVSGSGRILVRHRGEERSADTPAPQPPPPHPEPVTPPAGRAGTVDDAREALAELLAEWGRYRLDAQAWYLTKPLLHDVTGTVAATVTYNAALQALSDAVDDLHDQSPQPVVDRANTLADRAWEAWHAANDYAAQVGVGDRSPTERRALQRLHTLVERLLHSSAGDPDLAMVKREVQQCLDKITTVSVSWTDIAAFPAIRRANVLPQLPKGGHGL